MPRGVLNLDNALGWIAEALEKLSGFDLENIADINDNRAGHIARIDYVAEQALPGGGAGLNTEQVIDAVAVALVAGTNVTITYNDPAGTITLAASGGGGGSSAWGGITGTLSAQTDLQAALNAKMDDSQASAYGLTLLDDADATTARATLGLGTLATQSGTSSGINTGDQSLAAYATTSAVAAGYQPLDSDLTSIAALTTLVFGRSLLTLLDAAAGRTAFGLVIGTDVQAYDVDLTTYANISPSANVQTLLGAATFAAFRTSLGLGSSALVNTGTSGTSVALTDGANTWSAAQTFSALVTISAGAQLTPATIPAVNAMGYLGVPQNIQDANYTAVMADAGKHLYHTSATPHTWTLPANASVAYPIGTVVTFINATGAGAITLAITTDTLRWGALTGTRALAANGVATAIKTTATVWRLTGDGIT